MSIHMILHLDIDISNITLYFHFTKSNRARGAWSLIGLQKLEINIIVCEWFIDRFKCVLI